MPGGCGAVARGAGAGRGRRAAAGRTQGAGHRARSWAQGAGHRVQGTGHGAGHGLPAPPAPPLLPQPSQVRGRLFLPLKRPMRHLRPDSSEGALPSVLCKAFLPPSVSRAARDAPLGPGRDALPAHGTRRWGREPARASARSPCPPAVGWAPGKDRAGPSLLILLRRSRGGSLPL